MRAIPNESRRKQYVKVIAAHLVDGTVEPQVIILDKGKRFCIESVKEVKAVTTLPPYEFVNRYTVLIKGRETALYEENGRFFVKMKN